MDKNAIKKYAVWARRELISRVSQRALLYGISEKDCGDMYAETINGHLLTSSEKKQRQSLFAKIKKDGYQQAMEAAAYTWFNRFCALRFMEVNGYLPSHVRVFTDEQNAFKPQILAEAIHLEIDGLNMDKVYELKDANKTDELYKYLLIVQCNALGNLLPGMFTRIEDYTELLFPDNLLREGSVIEQMIAQIPADNFDVSSEKGQLEIIGWLYQYYISEKHEEVVDPLHGKVVKKEEVPAATQLFTTDWVVRYIIDNSVGRYWIERNPNSTLKNELEYFVTPKDGNIPVVNEAVKPQDVTVLDPCVGSGHFLVYAFEVLIKIYVEYGYSEREAASEIVAHNLFGLDIDERAVQLAYFAVMMKARQYDRRFLTRGVKPHLFAIEESNDVDSNSIDFFCGNDVSIKRNVSALVETFRDAKEYGSILQMPTLDFDKLYERLNSAKEEISLFGNVAVNQFEKIIDVANVLSQKYAIVATNPPYLNKYDDKLKGTVQKLYKEYSGDLFSVFMYRNFLFCKENGYSGFMTPFVWMFIQTYEELRKYILTQKSILTLIQMEYSAFEEATVPICSFVLKNGKSTSYAFCYRLSAFKGGMEVQKERVLFANKNKSCGYLYETDSEDLLHIPGTPIAYWASKTVINAFSNKLISDYAFSDGQILTGDNNKYLRCLWEVSAPTIVDLSHWALHAKGGEYRRWYGNIDTVVSWTEDSKQHYKKDKIARFPKEHILFREGITWSLISSSDMFGMRWLSPDTTFNKAAATILFDDTRKIPYYLGYLNSTVARNLLKMLNPTLNTNIKDILALPIIEDPIYFKPVEKMVEDNICLSRQDWDSFETSWDFKHHPLVANMTSVGWEGRPSSALLRQSYETWEAICADRFKQLKANEEELNRIFIDIYGLQDELTPEVEDKDVTVRKADLQRDIKSLISYAVGCMFGRYSLDVDGLAYAGGEISEQWVVVSGQFVNRRVVEYYVGKELSRAFGMAEIHGVGNGNIQFGEAAAERGAVFTFGSNAEGCGFDSVQYRRGTTKKLYEGIRELSVDCKGFQCGIADSVYDLCSPEILNAISSGNSAELVGRGWKDADGIDWKAVRYSLTTNHYTPDKDNIIPICDDEYFDDDIVARFVKFIETVYGKDTLEENLRFIADALGGKGASRDVIRSYFLNDFYADHLKIYQKRPIYWLFDSGKKGGFKALIYMHRYQPDTIARIRTDYVHEQQARYRTAIADLENRVAGASTSERVKLNKQLAKLQAQADEIHDYEEKIHHLADQMIRIDLDDGVKHNYELFVDVLAKIK